MSVFKIPRRHVFPHPSLADESGLIGVGGDLHPSRLLLAYQMGIFPWYSDSQPILWWSPDPRMVLEPGSLRVSRSLKKRMRRGDYTVTVDCAFAEVMRQCSLISRPNQEGTWITDEMVNGYVKLYEEGWAHSVEAWRGDELVGGLYGVAVGRLFCGESMFARTSDASKVAFVLLVRQLERWGYGLIDCQVPTEHLKRFGAELIPRQEYLAHIDELVADTEHCRGRWQWDPDLSLTK